MTRPVTRRIVQSVAIDQVIAARDQVLAADAAERPLTELLSDVLQALHGVATFSFGALLLTDTDSMLPFGGVVEGLDPSQCTPFWDNELLDPDFAKFSTSRATPSTTTSRQSSPSAMWPAAANSSPDSSPTTSSNTTTQQPRTAEHLFFFFFFFFFFFSRGDPMNPETRPSAPDINVPRHMGQPRWRRS